MADVVATLGNARRRVAGGYWVGQQFISDADTSAEARHHLDKAERESVQRLRVISDELQRPLGDAGALVKRVRRISRSADLDFAFVVEAADS
jgi:hypothetical protein